MSSYQIPDGFEQVLKDLNREILREQPNDIISFCAAFFNSRIQQQVTPQEACSDDEDDVMEEVAALPPQNHSRLRRTSVSAESMAPSQEAYVKIIVPKSDEQRIRIDAAIRNNFLFKSLDEDQYKDVVDAMAEKRVFKDTTIIKQGGIGDFFYVADTGAFDVYVSKNGEPAKKGNFI